MVHSASLGINNNGNHNEARSPRGKRTFLPRQLQSRSERLIKRLIQGKMYAFIYLFLSPAVEMCIFEPPILLY